MKGEWEAEADKNTINIIMMIDMLLVAAIEEIVLLLGKDLERGEEPQVLNTMKGEKPYVENHPSTMRGVDIDYIMDNPYKLWVLISTIST